MMVNSNAFSVHWAIAYPIGIIIIFLAACLGYKLSEKSENENLIQTVLFLTVVSLVTMIIIMSTKEIMDRPRFRFVLESGEAAYFKNWWQSGSEIKASLASGALSDEFSSFPSGHSAYSMFAVFLFPAFADYVPKLKKYRSILFVFGFLWWTLTAFSRMTVGAHYLTDVSVAAIVTLIGYTVTVLLKNIILRRIKK